ncbi:hypothetical protein ALC53_05634, partial [Atta colombica]
KLLRNRAQIVVRKAKSDYYLSVFNGSQSFRKVWSRLKHLGLIKDKNNDGRRNTIDLIWDEKFDNSKFYWNYVTPMDITRVFGLMRFCAAQMMSLLNY